MPTENFMDGKIVAFDMETGKNYEIGHVKDTELSISDSIDEQEINYFESKALSIKIQNRWVVYYLYWLIGKKNLIPNNWLKRHGFPMNRRKAYE